MMMLHRGKGTGQKGVWKVSIYHVLPYECSCYLCIDTKAMFVYRVYIRLPNSSFKAPSVYNTSADISVLSDHTAAVRSSIQLKTKYTTPQRREQNEYVCSLLNHPKKKKDK